MKKPELVGKLKKVRVFENEKKYSKLSYIGVVY